MTQALIVVGIVIAVLALLIIFIGPVQGALLARKYAKFRQNHQAEHDAIDAQFNHNDIQVDGTNWHFVDYGPRDGPVILLLHGLPEGWYSWKHVMPFIDAKCRLIVPDMKGYGRSTPGDSNYNWHTVARQTLGLMDTLKIQKFYVVGHDWGALIGSVMVDDHQDRILGFVRMEADFVPNRKTSSRKKYLLKPHWVIFPVTWMTRMIMRDVEQFIGLVYIRSQRTRMSREDLDYFIYEYSRPGVVQNVSLYFKHSNWDMGMALGKFCKKQI